MDDPVSKTETPDLGPNFINPFNPSTRSSSLDQTPQFTINDIDASSSHRSLRNGYGAGSISSRASISGSNPDLLSHQASVFASSRRQSMTRSATQVFKKPRPSTMLKDEIPKPWLKYKDPAHRWARWIFWGIWCCALAIVVGLCYDGYKSIPQIGNVCLVMDDSFSSNQISSLFWEHEVSLYGGRLGQFEWLTASPNNSFISDQTLYLVPTLTADSIGAEAVINAGHVNLTADGTCTDKNVSHCYVESNSTLGTVINPVQGVKLKSKSSITYGKVEIVARLPKGDWIFPAMRLIPDNTTYGDYPRSGEIDILNARGNAPGYGNLGSDYMQSALHWGPHPLFDSYYRTWGIRQDKVNGYANGFRKYTIEWNQDYIMMYIDNKVQTALTVKFDQKFWARGDYPTFYTDQNGDIAKLENPWYGSPNNAAPFDQPFHLEIQLSVGATSTYFPDNLGNKPWQDSSPLASADFWTAKDRWLPTWPQDVKQRGMAIKSVKMYKTC